MDASTPIPILRLFDLLDHRLITYPEKDVLFSKINTKWVPHTIEEVYTQSHLIAKALLQRGIQQQDRIGIIAGNSPQWTLCDMGILISGAVDVPVYTSLQEDELYSIFAHAEVKLIFTGDEVLTRKILNIQDKLPGKPEIISFVPVPGCTYISEFIQEGNGVSDESLYQRKSLIKTEEMATLIYTSGTTGEPKGVMLSHQNIISNFKSNVTKIPVTPGGRALSFLPLCHVYERMCTYMYLYRGLSIWYAESLEKISDNLKEVKPHIFTTVPRLLEKVYDKIILKGKTLRGLKRILFDQALKTGHKYKTEPEQSSLYKIQLYIARKIIFRKWQEALGGNVQAIVSGGAALQVRLAKIFWAAGIPVAEGYGLTETSPVVAVNYFTPNSLRFGTVGKIIEGCAVKIEKENLNDPEGEILVKGSNVMMGYFKAPELTKDSIDAEGWFHTGDIGRLDTEGFLKITDRKKEIFKTSGGKYIAPQQIENKLKESLYISQVMVIGENQNHPYAIIVIDKEYVRNFLIESGFQKIDNKTMHTLESVKSLLYKEVKETGKSLSVLERIHRFTLVSDEWTQETRELTPTLKLRRKFLYLKYKDVIEALYRL